MKPVILIALVTSCDGAIYHPTHLNYGDLGVYGMLMKLSSPAILHKKPELIR